jgi:hypothetical protein
MQISTQKKKKYQGIISMSIEIIQRKKIADTIPAKKRKQPRSLATSLLSRTKKSYEIHCKYEKTILLLLKRRRRRRREREI